MKSIIKFLLVSFLTATVTSYAGRAIADESAQSARKTAQKEAETKSSEAPAAFVDKDGDGISDGKEHRFRKRSTRHSGADGQQMKQRRNQYRNGQGNGNGSQGR